MVKAGNKMKIGKTTFAIDDCWVFPDVFTYLLTGPRGGQAFFDVSRTGGKNRMVRGTKETFDPQFKFING